MPGSFHSFGNAPFLIVRAKWKKENEWFCPNVYVQPAVYLEIKKCKNLANQTETCKPWGKIIKDLTPSISSERIGTSSILLCLQIFSIAGIVELIASFPRDCLIAISQNETILTYNSFSVVIIWLAVYVRPAGLQRL